MNTSPLMCGYYFHYNIKRGSLHLEIILKSVENYLNMIDSMMDEKHTSQIG